MSEFKERTIEVVGSAYNSSGAKGLRVRDIETGEEYKLWADDLVRVMSGMTFSVNAKVIKAGYRQQALRIAK